MAYFYVMNSGDTVNNCTAVLNDGGICLTSVSGDLGCLPSPTGDSQNLEDRYNLCDYWCTVSTTG